jgi:hypothetical protein
LPALQGIPFFKSVDHLRIGVRMRGAGHQIVVAKPMQEGIDAIERIELAEVLLDLLPKDGAIVGGELFRASDPFPAIRSVPAADRT